MACIESHYLVFLQFPVVSKLVYSLACMAAYVYLSSQVTEEMTISKSVVLVLNIICSYRSTI